MKLQWSLLWCALLFGLFIFATTAYADSVYDEDVNGDLSGDRNAPTGVRLSAGQNRLSATSVKGDLEYVHITVPHGYQLEQTVVFTYQSTDQRAFIGIQRGSVFTEPNTGANPAHLLGYSHFGPAENNVGTDILDNIGTGAGAAGFTPPLAGGDYALWLQQAGTATTTYSLDFYVGPTTSTMSYDEAVDGDISGDRLNPVTRTLIVGGNVISATSVRNDREYLRITVPLGHQLEAMLLTAYSSTDKISFAAVQTGVTFSEPPQGTNVARLLGYSHFGPDIEPIGADLLDNMAVGAGALGFNKVLGSGDYTFWLQQTKQATTTYALELVVAAAPTRTLHSEAASGDLANAGATPTALTAAKGGNVLAATSVQGDREYFTLEVPVGHRLEAIFLTAYNSTDEKAFIGVQKGATFTEPPTNTTVGNLLGYSHFGPSVEPVGSNILDNIGAGAGAQGFTGSLSSGAYTFWTQQASTNSTTYTLNFVISELPLASRTYLPAMVK